MLSLSFQSAETAKNWLRYVHLYKTELFACFYFVQRQLFETKTLGTKIKISRQILNQFGHLGALPESLLFYSAEIYVDTHKLTF